MTDQVTQTERKGAKADKKVILAVMLGSCVAYSGVMSMPLWIGAVTDGLGLNPSIPGYMGSVQLIVAAASSFWVSRNLDLWSARKFALIGMLLLILANMLSAFSSGILLLFIARGLSGMAEGMLLANLNAFISRMDRPDRLFALSLTTVGIFGIFVFALVPGFIGDYGPVGIFGFVALAGVIALAGLGGFSRDKPAVQLANDIAGEAGASDRKVNSLLPLVALAVVFVGCQGGWAYMERMGVSKGFSIGTIGAFLIVGQVISLFGPLSANLVSKNLGRKLAILLGVTISGLAVMLASQDVPADLYRFSASSFQFGTLFIVTSYLSYLAHRDPSGAAAAAAPAFMNLGSALGPATMGAVLGWGGFALVGWVVIGIYILGLGLLSVSTKASAVPARSI